MGVGGASSSLARRTHAALCKRALAMLLVWPSAMPLRAALGEGWGDRAWGEGGGVPDLESLAEGIFGFALNT